MTAHWQTRVRSKLVDPAAAIRHIRPGEAIYLSDGSATPLGIIPYLCDPRAPLADHVIHHMLTLGRAPYVEPQYAGRFRHNALFIGENVRHAVVEGRADYTPVFLSEIPGLIRSGRIPVDVAILSLTPPDPEGWCSLGTHVDLAPAACEVARLVIGVVNAKMPRTFGPGRLHVDQVHVLTECEAELPELPPARQRPESQAIARLIADLVPDGATLQLGIGSIPDHVLTFLHERNDLGIHTEMLSDGVVELAQRGVITGARKTLHRGKIVATLALGTRKTYDFVRENPAVELHPVDHTNDPYVIMQNDQMIAINNCIQIDLTGQVCSDSIGEQFYSGIGGQVDFIRGAARSRGGKAILALTSTTSNGTISRIVPRLDDGAGVVTTRGDVHWVVTEYGATNLHGLNARERALALVSLAHPKFRPWLLAEAKQRRLIYLDQIEPLVRVPLYPMHLETQVQDDRGQTIRIRPVKPTDESILHDLFYALSPETRRHVFLSAATTILHEDLQHYCNIDYERDMTLLATVEHDNVEEAIGWARFDSRTAADYAHASFVMRDDWRGRGIGKHLMARLTEIAKARGVRGFRALVPAHDVALMHVLAHCGYVLERRHVDDMIDLRVPFEQVGPG